MDNTKNRTILSLCTGYGGLERGIEAIIGKCFGLAYVEVEAFAVANLVNKMEAGKLDPVPIWTDLKTFDAKPFRNCVDILTGGYPCQPFSAAGKRNGTEDPRHLWPYIRTIIMDCKPGQCFLENVEGHLTLGISEVLSDLEAMGYRSEVGIFSAAEAGAPHQRKRVFILADSEQQGPQRLRFEKQTRRGESSSLYPNGRTCSQWPSRPGEPQHDWEEPRTVMDDTKGRKSKQYPKNERAPNGQSDFSGFTSPLSGELADTTDTDRRTGKEGIETKEKQRGDRSPNERRQLVNTGSEKRQGIPQSTGRLEDRKTRNPGGEGETKSELGRTINGTRNRVDRLRLLGNGVVTQTAAKAYLTLWRKLNAN